MNRLWKELGPVHNDLMSLSFELTANHQQPGRCIMCHDAATSLPCISCPECGAIYHEECVLETCQTLGCDQQLRKAAEHRHSGDLAYHYERASLMAAKAREQRLEAGKKGRAQRIVFLLTLLIVVLVIWSQGHSLI